MDVLLENEIKITKPLAVKSPLSSMGGYIPKEKGFDPYLFDQFDRTKNPSYLLKLLSMAQARKNTKFYVRGEEISGINLKYELWDMFFNPNRKTEDFINYPRYTNGMIPRSRDFVREVMRNKEKYPLLPSHVYTWLKVLFLLRNDLFEASNNRDTMNNISKEVFYYRTRAGIKKGTIAVKEDGTITPTPFSTSFAYSRNPAFDLEFKPIPYSKLSGGIPFEEFKRILHSDELERMY